MADEDLSDLERYFRDPKLGESILQVGIASPVCINIRHALRVLGFYGEFGSREFSESYDTSLAQLVLRFQEARNHTSRDGVLGGGRAACLHVRFWTKPVRTFSGA